jgi:hypothetical protein
LPFDGASKLRDGAVDGLEEAPQDAVGILGIAPGGQSRVAGQIGKQNGDLPAFTLS